MIKPVDWRAPKARAIKVTLNMDIPLSPALEAPIKKVATDAKNQPNSVGSDEANRIKGLV